MHTPHLGPQQRQVMGVQLPVGAALTAKAVGGRAVGIQRDHGQRGGRVQIMQVSRAHAFIHQHLFQPLAQVVGRQPGKQCGVDAQATQAHRHVEG